MITISDKKTVGKRELFTVTTEMAVIKDCCVMPTKSGGHFVAGPSRSYTDKQSGEVKYVNLVSFTQQAQDEIMGIIHGAVVPDKDVNSYLIDDCTF